MTTDSLRVFLEDWSPIRYFLRRRKNKIDIREIPDIVTEALPLAEDCVRRLINMAFGNHTSLHLLVLSVDTVSQFGLGRWHFADESSIIHYVAMWFLYYDYIIVAVVVITVEFYLNFPSYFYLTEFPTDISKI